LRRLACVACSFLAALALSAGPAPGRLAQARTQAVSALSLLSVFSALTAAVHAEHYSEQQVDIVTARIVLTSSGRRVRALVRAALRDHPRLRMVLDVQQGERGGHSVACATLQVQSQPDDGLNPQGSHVSRLVARYAGQQWQARARAGFASSQAALDLLAALAQPLRPTAVDAVAGLQSCAPLGGRPVYGVQLTPAGAQRFARMAAYSLGAAGLAASCAGWRDLVQRAHVRLVLTRLGPAAQIAELRGQSCVRVGMGTALSPLFASAAADGAAQPTARAAAVAALNRLGSVVLEVSSSECFDWRVT